MEINTAVIPAAGIGSRFLPWTKAMPKEMLPVIDKPVLQYVVEECIDSGIEKVVIVVNEHKPAIKKYFQKLPYLEKILKQQGKLDRLEKVRDVTNQIKIQFVNQKQRYGNAVPVLSAQKAVGNQPFAVLWGDQFILAKPPRLKQLIDSFAKHKSPVVAGIRVGKEEMTRRGMCKLGKGKGNLFQLKQIIEKPVPEKSPSDLAAYGTYVLTPDIFPILEKLQPGKKEELWLTDAINKLLNKRTGYALELDNAQFYDAGNKLNYHKTVIDLVLEDEEIGETMRSYLNKKLLY
jgi:UTP--glucose-1-phosphate uridylyltransferase